MVNFLFTELELDWPDNYFTSEKWQVEPVTYPLCTVLLCF